MSAGKRDAADMTPRQAMRLSEDARRKSQRFHDARDPYFQPHKATQEDVARPRFWYPPDRDTGFIDE